MTGSITLTGDQSPLPNHLVLEGRGISNVLLGHSSSQRSWDTESSAALPMPCCLRDERGGKGG